MKKSNIVYLLLPFVCLWAYAINELNYQKHKEIESFIVRHPEKLPDPTFAKIGSFWFKNMLADIYWLQTIQYIWWNVIEWEYKEYLYSMMHLITELSPHFESPYVIWQLLLPSSNARYEGVDVQKNQLHINEGEKLWLKWIRNFCDMQIVEAIKKEEDLWKILNNAEYRNPCISYKVPYYLAYIYYFYMKDGAESSLYYKVVSAQDDAPEWAKTLAAIMQWKGGEREKSLLMFLSLAENVANNDQVCMSLSQELRNIYTNLQKWLILLDGNLISLIQTESQKVFPEITDENENELLDNTKCLNFLWKAIRELNLIYIEAADRRYIQDNPSEVSAWNPELLLEKGYINFIPTDYQQYADEWNGIIYEYNPEIKRFDYIMSY